MSTLRLCCYGYPIKMAFTADDKQFIKSLRPLTGYSSRKLLQEFPHREIGHAEDLSACLQKLINMGWQKEFQAVGDYLWVPVRESTWTPTEGVCMLRITSSKTSN